MSAASRRPDPPTGPGQPDVLVGAGKRVAEIIDLVGRRLAGSVGPVLVTRLDAPPAAHVLRAVPGGSYDAAARLLAWRPCAPAGFHLAVVSAAASDASVAAEAAGVASALGLLTSRADAASLLMAPGAPTPDAVVCVAGLDGALPSALAGRLTCPVIAAPSSTGAPVGSLLDGTALLAMLRDYVPGVLMVSVDSGCAAALAAHRIARAASR